MELVKFYSWGGGCDQNSEIIVFGVVYLVNFDLIYNI